MVTKIGTASHIQYWKILTQAATTGNARLHSVGCAPLPSNKVCNTFVVPSTSFLIS